MTAGPRRRVVLVRPRRAAPGTQAQQSALWLRRRTIFGRLAISLLFLAVVMFATGSPGIGAFVGFASVLSLAVVVKARRYIDRTSR